VAYENLRFRKPHLAFVEGYFYMFDDDTDMLLVKSDDGATAFSYPFDIVLDSTIISVEYDGINFWTMEVGPVDDSGEEDLYDIMIIRRWRIENYICCLKEVITLDDSENIYTSDTFTVEHYHCTISGSYNVGDYSVFLNDELPGELVAGMDVSLFSGTSSETITVQDINNNYNEIVLADPIVNSYEDGDSLLFYNFIWMFNNADSLNTSTGSLYKINGYSGQVIQKFNSGAYKDVTACTFSEITHFMDVGAVNSLMFVKASNLLFINTNKVPLTYYGSMAMDTIASDAVTIIPVYDLAINDQNLYRLQKKATYYGGTVDWSDYNYQAATFEKLVASISMTASPSVIAANQVSTSSLSALVRDQFGQPVQSKLVYFTDDDDDGEIVSGDNGTNTNSSGEAVAVYKSGLSARLVKITATVNQ